MKGKIFFLIGLIFVLGMFSCDNTEDKEYLIEAFEQDANNYNYTYELEEGNVTRYDDKGYKVDKHWFDKGGNMILYTFYNRFHQTEKATCRIQFNENHVPDHLEGQPFYVSSNLVHNDSIVIDNVKAYIYLANSPFFETSLKVITQIEPMLSNEQYIAVEEEPSFVIYFEDSINNTIENRIYDFLFDLSKRSFKYRDTISFNSYVVRQ